MTDIEKQALALVNEVNRERGLALWVTYERTGYADAEALCRALEMLNAEREAHAATKRDMSDAVEDTKFMVETHCDTEALALVSNRLNRFIIKPPVDPRVVEVCDEVNGTGCGTSEAAAVALEAALAARGGRIVFDGGE